MTTLREAAQKALEALEWHLEKGAWGADIEGVTAALRTALAQQAEPAAWMLTDAQNTRLRFLEWQKETRPYSGEWIKTPLYTAPPQRKPLTDEEIGAAANSVRWSEQYHIKFARAIEKAHGIE